jgi:DNA-directed RNA polymerase omega subunit
LNNYGEIDSKFRFVHLASKRAKMLLKGAKPKVKTKSKNPIRIAQTEVREGVVDFEIITPRQDELSESEERVFLGGDGLVEADDSADETAGAGEEAADQEEAEADLSVEFDEDSSDDSGENEKQ